MLPVSHFYKLKILRLIASKNGIRPSLTERSDVQMLKRGKTLNLLINCSIKQDEQVYNSCDKPNG